MTFNADDLTADIDVMYEPGLGFAENVKPADPPWRADITYGIVDRPGWQGVAGDVPLTIGQCIVRLSDAQRDMVTEGGTIDEIDLRFEIGSELYFVREVMPREDGESRYRCQVVTIHTWPAGYVWSYDFTKPRNSHQWLTT